MNVERLSAVLQAEGTGQSGQSVKQKAALRVLPESFGCAREFLENLLRSSSGDSRDDVKEIFGDCKSVAHIQMLIEKVEALVPADFKDERLSRCKEACTSIEKVLEDIGLGEKLRSAKEKEHQASSMPELLPNAPALNRMTSQARQTILEEIDDLLDDSRHRQEAMNKMEILFNDYADTQGFLIDDSYEQVVRDLTRYVRKEWDDRNKRLRASGKAIVAQVYEGKTEEWLRDWVIKAIDPDNDGCITMTEALTGFETCVNEIDPPKRGTAVSAVAAQLD